MLDVQLRVPAPLTGQVPAGIATSLVQRAAWSGVDGSSRGAGFREVVA